MKKGFLFILRLIFDVLGNIFTGKKIILVTEGANWSIDEDSKNIMDYLEKNSHLKVRLSLTPAGAKNKVIHFMSVNTYLGKYGIRDKENILYSIHSSNKIFLTWFHIIDNDERIKFIQKLNNAVEYVHTASTITKKKLVSHGLNENKIILIPLGVDLKVFSSVSETQKENLKLELKLPKDKIIIGSFQKDGVGWGEGIQPKMEKGPDIFCEAVEKIARKIPIHVLLTGPARGYVKKRFESTGIPYTHKYLHKYKDIVNYYRVLDLYLMCSREEGGPKAPLESMACGVPVIATLVGMVPDVIESGVDGISVSKEDSGAIANEALRILNDRNLKNNLIQNALKKIQNYDLDEVEEKFHRFYKSLI